MWRRTALLLSLSSLVVFAEKPVLDAVYPAGATRGQTNQLTLIGKLEPWPPQIWCSDDGVIFVPQTNKGSVHVAVSPLAAPGPRFIRIYNQDGASDPRIFLIAAEPEEQEKEPNDHFRKAQLIGHLPKTINGRLEKNGDVDSYLLELKSGQWLSASIDAYKLMSKIDPVLRLLTADGYQLAWNHDYDTLDSRLQWRSPKNQSVVLQVFGFAYPANSEIQLSGAAAGVYRLHLNDKPSSENCLNEREPNNATNTARDLAFNEVVVGTICPDGDQDRFRVTLKKDETVEIQVAAAAIGSPLDPWVAVEDATGKELARNDDASDGTRDCRLEWKAPADGEYLFVTGSVTRSATTNFRYQLSARRLLPDFTATLSENNFIANAGETNQIKVNLKRLRGFINELTIGFDGLPEGVSCAPAKPDIQSTEINLSLLTDAAAPPWNGVVNLVVKDHTSGEKRPIEYQFVSRSVDNGVPGGYTKLLLERTSDLWLTVKPKPADKK